MQDITARGLRVLPKHPCELNLYLICTYDTGLTDNILIELKSACVRGWYHAANVWGNMREIYQW